MSVGKVDDLVSQAALDQLTELYQRLGITKDQMASATEQAVKFTQALGDTKSLQDFQKASEAAANSMQTVISANNTILSQQKEITIQTQAATDAVKIKVTADANADAVLKQVGGSLDANIKQLIQQKIELKNVNDQLRDLSKQYAGTQQSQNAMASKTAELTAKQVALKDAVAQQNLIIKQQVKENNAAETSQDAMLARLNLLRKAYNSLSEEERNNAQVGGVLLGQIKQLAQATTEINQAQGKYNDSVGKYEDAIKSAISSYVPFGNQIVKAVDTFNTLTKETTDATVATAGLGTKFAAFSIAEFAIAIAAATYYLQQFRNTGQDVEQYIGGLKNQFANLGKNVIDIFQGKKVNPFDNFVNSFNQGVDITKAIQDVKNLNEVNDQQIQILQGQADRYRALAKNQKASSEERIASLQKAQKVENDIIKQQKDNAAQNIDAGLGLAQKGVKPLLPSRLDQLRGKGQGGFVEAAQAANDLAQAGKITEAGYEALMAAYQRETQAMNSANMKLIRQQNDEAKIGLKGAKELNNDELELQKAKLTGEKETAKLILDDNQQSYEARLAALKIYVERSKAIIGTENTIADRAPGASSTKKKVNAQNAKNQIGQVDNFDLNEQQKIDADRLRDRKEANEEILKEYKALEQRREGIIQDGLNEELLDKDLARSEEVLKISEQYTKNEISEKEYQNKIRAIRKKAAAEGIDIEIDALKEILKVQEENVANGAITPKQVQETKNRITKLTIQSNDLKADGAADSSKGDKLGAKERAKEAVAFSEQLVKGLDIAQGLIDQNAQQKIAALENEFALIQRNGEAEKTRIGNSILSSKEKAREQSIVDAQVAQQRIRITQQENEVKKKQAEFDKAAAIAKIIQQTAVAVVSALTIPIYGEVLAGVIGALGAAQLAVAIATPIPQFYKGTKNAPEGLAHVGERGTELQINPDGSMGLTPNTDTITYLKKGTQIIPNHELVAMLGKPEQIPYILNFGNDNKKVEKYLAKLVDGQNKQPRTNIHVHTDKWGAYSQQRNY